VAYGTRYTINLSPVALEFNSLVFSTSETDLDESIEEIFELAKKLARQVRLSYADLELDISFDKGVALDFIRKFLNKDVMTSPARTVTNLAYSEAQKIIQSSAHPLPADLDIYVYEVDLHSKLATEEEVSESALKLPLHLRCAALYLIYFPAEINAVLSMCSSTLEKFIVLRTFDHLRRTMDISRSTQEFNFALPQTEISRILVASALYKLNPAMLVLLMLFKDVTSLLQFCTLFEGQNLEIPSITDIRKVIQKASSLSERMEARETTVGDREALALLATELKNVADYDTDVELTPLLSKFFERILSVTLKNYEEYQERIIRTVNAFDPKDVANVYEVLNKELATQIELMTLISGSLEGGRDIKNIVSILSKRETN
jgi:hypothetical protein